jgi:hypothetical protein
VKPSELRAHLAAGATSDEDICDAGGCDDVEEVVFDDDDFYEAIQLLDEARESIKMTLKYCNVGPTRRHFLEKLCDEIKQFEDQFVVNVREADED